MWDMLLVNEWDEGQCWWTRSGEALGDGLGAGAAHLADVLPGQGVLVLDFDLVDEVSSHLLLLNCVHQVDLNRVVSGCLRGYVWMMAQPPVWMYSSATPLASLLSLSLMKPGGSTCRAAGLRFCTTRIESRFLVMRRLQPAKSSTMVPGWGRAYCRGCGGSAPSASFWRRRRKRAG